MHPHLIALAGEFKGQTFVLTDDFLIGRKAADLCLNDPAISRRHCSIRKEGVQFILRDLDSHNGTLVNGKPIAERQLAHGDRIRLSDSVFLVVLTEGELPPVSADIQFVDQDIDATHTQVLRIEDAEYVRPAEALSESVADVRIRQDLAALLRIGMTAADATSLSSFQAHLMNLILEVIPADAGAIVLLDGSGSVTSAFAEASKDEKPIPVSMTVINRVVRDRVAMLTNEIGGRLLDAKSLMLSDAKALLSVPLLVRNRAIGAIYLVSINTGGRFEERHLQLLTAVAAMISTPLDAARYADWLHSQNQRIQADRDAEYRMIGKSPAMKDVYSFISRVAAVEATVLITGESGTGKELVARAIHRLSARSRMPFIAVNCAALPELLAESELFGHEKGAFTGAVSQSKGKFESADGGTIFLDEVGELSPAVQGKLLRILQERELNRIGSARAIKVNVRVIAATNRNMEEEVRAGRFRKDLFYRLNVVALALPPLRERRDDIPLLAAHFLAKFAPACNRKIAAISGEAQAYLLQYGWPGNIRELENALERAVVLGLSATIVPEDLPEAILDSVSGAAADDATDFHAAVRAAKRQLIQRALDQCEGNHAEAAKQLGLNRTYLHRLIRVLGM